MERREQVIDICMAYGMSLRSCRLSKMTQEDAKIVQEFLQDEADLYDI